jgi:WD40 repeat protein
MRARLFAAVAPAVLLPACASAPPPPGPKPAATPSETVVVPPAPIETASAAAPPPPPPLAIGSRFQADPAEPLPAGAVARCGTTRMRAASPRAVAVTNSGTVWAVDEVNSRLFLRDVTAGADVAELPSGYQAVLAPDASFGVVKVNARAGGLVFFSVPKGERLGEVDIPLPAKPAPPAPKGKGGVLGLIGGSTHIDRLVLAPDGAALVVTTTDGSAHLVGAASRKLEKTVKLPAKTRLTGVGNGGGRAVVELLEREESPFSVLFSSAGREAILGYAVLDLRTGATVRKATFKKPPVDPNDPDAPRPVPHAYARYRISADGAKVYRLEDGDLTAIDVTTGKESDVIEAPPARGSSGSFGGFGAFAAAPVFEILGGERVLLDGQIFSLKDGSLDVSAGPGFDAISPDGEHVVGHDGKVFELSSGGPKLRQGHDGEVTDLAFLPDNRLVAVAKQATFWNTEDCTWAEQPRHSAEHAVTASRKAATFLFGGGTAVLVDDKRQVSRLAVKPAPRLAALSPDADTLYLGSGNAYGGPGTLQAMDLAEGAGGRVRERSFSAPLRSIAVAPDGGAIAVSTAHSQSVALLSTDSLSTTVEVTVEGEGQVAFAGSDRLIFGAGYYGLSVRAVPSLTEVSRLHLHACCEAMAASPDGKLAAGVHGREILVWDVAARKLVGRVGKAHREEIRSIVFSADSRYLATGSGDTTVLLWDVGKLGVPPLPDKAETRLTGAAEAKRFFDVTRQSPYRIKADGTLEATGKSKPPALKSVTRVASGIDAHCAIAESKVRCWGSTRAGLLGIPEQRGNPKWRFVERAAPATLPVKDPVDVRVSRSYACALERGGDLQCWGQLDYKSPPEAPAKVLGGVKSFDLDGDRVCAVGSDGLVRCFDRDARSPKPLAVKDAVAVAVGRDHVCALDKAGVVRCQGKNDWDQLGDDTGLDRASPVEAVGLSGALAVVAGESSTCALTGQQAVYCWGSLGSDQLGRPTVIAALAGATALRFEGNGVCGLVGDRVECVKPRWESD